MSLFPFFPIFHSFQFRCCSLQFSVLTLSLKPSIPRYFNITVHICRQKNTKDDNYYDWKVFSCSSYFLLFGSHFMICSLFSIHAVFSFIFCMNSIRICFLFVRRFFQFLSFFCTKQRFALLKSLFVTLFGIHHSAHFLTSFESFIHWAMVDWTVNTQQELIHYTRTYERPIPLHWYSRKNRVKWEQKPYGRLLWNWTESCELRNLKIIIVSLAYHLLNYTIWSNAIGIYFTKFLSKFSSFRH